MYDAAKKDDDVARQVVRETANFLGAGVANLLNIFNPDVVVIAGGVTQAGEPLFEPLARGGAASRVQARRRGVPDSCRGRCRDRRASSARSRRSSSRCSTAVMLMAAVVTRRKRRLGVIGTFVWDVIYGRDPRERPVEEWGGITYALSALDAALPDDWEIVPLVRVGDDLAERGASLHRARCVAPRLTRRRSRCRTRTIASSCATTATSDAASD